MPCTWWPILLVTAFAAAWDVCCRRIPNWLTLPFLVAGLIGASMGRGLAGAGSSLAGIAIGVAAFAPLCLLGGMGLGDLKLGAAVGAWIGPSHLPFALVMTAIAGGVMALIYALCRNSLGQMLDGTALLAGGVWRNRAAAPTLDSPGALTIPYAPAIAVGTLFAYLAR